MKVTKNELMAIPTPVGTDTWRPMRHVSIIDKIEEQLEEIGLPVVHQTFEIVGDKGEQLFASFILDQQKDGIRWSVGMRNSHNKSFALGITAGTYVIVCSNMVFSGEFIELRRHTKGLTNNELNEMINKAVAGIITKIEAQVDWQLQLKERTVNEKEMKVLTFDAISDGIILPSKFAEFTECLQIERNLNGDCLYSFHGGVTRSLREANLFAINYRTNKLHNFIDNYMMSPIDVEPIVPRYHLGAN